MGSNPIRRISSLRKLETLDFIAYTGTALLFGSTQLKRRLFMHVGRLAGSGLWLAYAVQISSTPLIMTNIIAIGFELVAAIRFRDD